MNKKVLLCIVAIVAGVVVLAAALLVWNFPIGGGGDNEAGNDYTGENYSQTQNIGEGVNLPNGNAVLEGDSESTQIDVSRNISLTVIGLDGDYIIPRFDVPFELLAMAENTTVLAALNLGSMLAPRSVEVASREEGGNTHIQAIDGLSESAGGRWVFYINGTRSAGSANAVIVSEGDDIVWRFVTN